MYEIPRAKPPIQNCLGYLFRERVGIKILERGGFYMKLKRCLLYFILIACLVFCAGCNRDLPSATNTVSTTSTQSEDNSPELDVEETTSPIDTTGMYHISESNSWISIPMEYSLLSREMNEFSDELIERQMSKDDLVSYLDAYGTEFVAISPDENMEVMLKFKRTGFGSNNLSSQSEDVISGFAEGLQYSFGAKSYELIDLNGVTWVKLTYAQSILGSSIPADVVRYVTVAGGWDIFLWGSSYNGKLTSQNIQDLQTILESFILNAK